MSDEAVGTSTAEMAAEPATPAVPQATAGALLRQAREAAGVDLASLAAALKVSVKKLEALEGDRLDQLHDAVFLRGLASSVCRTLKLDPGPVLGLLPQSTAPRLADDESGLNTPFHTPGDIAKTPFLDRLSRPMVLAALAVLMGALVLIFFPSSEQRAELGAIVARPPAGPADTAPVAAAVPTSQPPAAVVPAAPVVPAAKPVAAAPVPAPAPVREAPVAQSRPVVPVNAPVAPAAATAPAKPAPVAAPVVAPAPVAAGVAPEAPVRKKLASTGIVVFKTREASWIEVTDAKGAIQLSRVIEPGEPVGASGPLPLSVSIGRADVTEVQVRGKPFPLEPVTKQGVARFEVQ